jgi:hypothetical protein
MILLKVNRTAAKENAVHISELQDPFLDQTPATLTKYVCAFTNTTDVSTVEIGGIEYTLDAAIDVSTAAGATALIEDIADILQSVGYGWDGELPLHFLIATTTTTFYTGVSQVVFDNINATAFTTDGTTVYGLSGS